MKNNASVAYAFALVVGDFVALLTAFVVAYILRVTLDQRSLINQIPSDQYLKIWVVIIPVWIVIFALLGLYRKNVYEYRLKEFSALLAGVILGIMAAITFDYASDTPIFPARLVPVYGLVIGYLLLILERTILRSGRMVLWRFGFGINNLLIIGEGKSVQNLINDINHPSKTGYKVVAVATKNLNIKLVGKHFSSAHEALEALPKLKANTILLVGISSDNKIADEALAAAQAHHTAFKFIPAHDGILNNNVEVELFHSLPVVSVHQTALTGWGRITKRLFDIFASAIGLIILSPILLIIAVGIKLSGRGPVIFKQQRLSRFDTPINIYKFRTMKQEFSGLLPEEGFAKMGKPQLAIKYRNNGDYLKNDPRVTKFGNFLRKTSLDELPQLVNVFKGNISLVGPRALVPRELKNYPYKNLILSVKSGITGLAQISGRKDIDFNERRALDLYYVQNWSFWLDIKILFRTVIDVLSGRGAR